jgi:hypothetical protein
MSTGTIAGGVRMVPTIDAVVSSTSALPAMTFTALEDLSFSFSFFIFDTL